MSFHLDYRRLDSGGLVDGRQFVQTNIRQPDGPASATVHKTLHCPPGIEQSHAVVVNDIAVLIAWIRLVPGLEGKGSVNEIEIQIVQSESGETSLESRLHALWPMICVPQLCRNKNIFTRKPSSGKSGLQGLAHLTLISISFRTIEMSKSSFQRVSGSTDGLGCIGNQGAEAEYRHPACPVVERHPFRPKIRRVNHADTSLAARIRQHTRQHTQQHTREHIRICGVSSTVRGGMALVIRLAPKGGRPPNGAHPGGSAYFNAELSHFIDQRSTRQSKPIGRSILASDQPAGLLQCFQDMLAIGIGKRA